MHGARDFQSCCIAADIRSVCQIFKGKLIVMNVMHRMFRRGIGNGEGSVCAERSKVPARSCGRSGAAGFGRGRRRSRGGRVVADSRPASRVNRPGLHHNGVPPRA